MRGSIRREEASCRSLRRNCSQHMRSVLPLVTTNNSLVIEGDHNFSTTSSTVPTSSGDSFVKDCRKISVGDCALFKPTKDYPPYIGLISLLRFSEENRLQLGVKWLYRPAEITIGKGTLVEGEPNEIFYSFHEDKIPAESLLHPCKVAFLPKGVDLPAGISSFVCRRVYDITNKCLRWLTDKDYINGRQKEIDQLLYRTRLEMHAPLQSCGRSPKQDNGPTSTSQVKPASDSCQNNIGVSPHSQMKGKKRERGDHGDDQVKRERCPRSDDNDSFQCKADSDLKAEIASITDRGGLVDMEGVEKLVQLMHLDKEKMNLVYRSVLAGVMAATDKSDCLNQFVHIGGLCVFDEWLRDVHKGKIGASKSLKDSDVSVDEFLLVLLVALDKLPVDLQALQLCNIGRSVNHLRSHKNSEIQKKSRSLVDTWKKRVEAELITNEAKSGCTQSVSVWPSKTQVTEASHSVRRTRSGSDAAMKSSLIQNAVSKTPSARSSHADSTIKSTTSSSGDVKLAPLTSCVKESLVKVPVEGSPDGPVVKEDRSSSSNQSHSQNQSSSGKEEAKSITGGALTVNKMSVTGSGNGFPEISGTGVQKDLTPGRSSSVSKSTPLEKLNESASSNGKVIDLPATEASSHKLIVKISDRVCSPARGVSGASQEDLANTSSRVSSPALSDKPEQCGRTSEENSDLHSNVSAEVSASPRSLPDEEKSMNMDSNKPIQGHFTNPSKSGKVHASYFSSMSALMSCVKYSDANSSMSLDDDVGMNLLASVAAGEVSKSGVLSCTESAECSPVAKDVCPGGGANKNSSFENNITSVEIQDKDDAEVDTSNPAVLDGTPSCQEGMLLTKNSSNDSDSRHKVELTQESIDCTINSSLRPTSSSEELEGEFVGVSPKENSALCETNDISDDKAGGVDSIISSKAEDCKPIIEGSASLPECNKPAQDASNGSSVVVSEKGADRLNFENKMDRVALGELPKSTDACCAVKEAAENLCPEKHVLLPKSEKKDSSSSQMNEGDKCLRASEMAAKLELDLNGRFNADEGKNAETASLAPSGSSTVRLMTSLTFSPNPILSSSSSITVAAAAKGHFVPPDVLLRTKGDFGWRGSAATSAFRPAEPRKVLETPLVASMPEASSSKRGRIAFDFDLNVPDERAYEETASADVCDMKIGFSMGRSKLPNEPSVAGAFRVSGALDLDLNRMDDACDTGNFSTSSLHKIGISPVPARDARKDLDLDLNDRPGVDANVNQFLLHQPAKVNMLPPQLSTAGLRMPGPGQGSFSSWFPPGNSYSTMAVFPPGATQRTFGPSGVASFTPEIYQGSVLPSSPAVAFPSSAFQFPIFPFGEAYRLPPATFSVGSTSYVDSSSGPRLFAPPVHTQFLGSVAPQFQRPYLVALPDNGNSESSSRRCGQPGFDLNAGPGAVESEIKEIFPMSSRQNSVSSSQSLPEEQARMFSAASGALKRKEPEGAWDSESLRFKQPSWH